MPLDPAGLQTRIVSGVSDLDEAEWALCYPAEAEDWRYYRACEAEAVPGVALAAVEVRDQHGLAAAAPLFQLAYRLDTPLQGALRRLSEAASRRLPSLTEWRMLGVGSPYADRCHIAVRPDLSEDGRAAALDALIAAVESEAERRNAAIVVYKDLAGAECAAIEGALGHHRYARIRSLPVASLDLNAADVTAYVAGLSAATRKDIRRKLKTAAAVRIERRTQIDDVADAISRLYDETRQHSGVDYGDFEALPRDYFLSVARSVGDRARFILYWVGEELAAFNLLLLGSDLVIDKFLGMRYPLARAHNLYVVSWIENVRFCLETGRRRLQSGQTAYAAKLRLGSRLIPSLIFARHRNPVINRLVRLAAPIAAFDRWDPDLRQLAAEGKAA
ncbi:MAG: GNAT family N-acetyltransferase [Rhodomicrobiaceae bacterium]